MFLFRFSSLFFLQQAGQNRLTRLPASIGLLRQLQTLMLNENLLEELPAELGSCQRLAVLSARKNKLERLPPELGQLSRLRVVNVSCNKLPHLPVSLLKLQPTLTALWLSEAQTKPIVPLQTDTDSGTGHKVLTCFLLPQTDTADAEPQPSAGEKESPAVSSVRSPTHIKFAFDGEGDHRAGRLMRNPTPYPKELKALAKHAQHIQQHYPTSPTGRNSIEGGDVKKQLLPSSPVVPADSQPTATALAVVSPPVSPPVPVVVSQSPVEPSVAVVSKLSSTGSNDGSTPIVTVRPKAELPLEPAPLPVVKVMMDSEPARSASPSPPPVEEPKYPPPLLVAQSPLPNRITSVEDLVASPEKPLPSPPLPPPPSQVSSPPPEIEIREARVLRPLKSSTDEEKPASPSDIPEPVKQQQPPPYHVAAAYSKLAAEFHPQSPLPRTQSTDSGFTVDGVAGSKQAVTVLAGAVPPVGESEHKRDSSPSRDSGRGPSIEPLEEPTTSNSSPPIAQPLPVKRPVDLPLNGLLDTDKVTPLMIKRATFIVESSPSSPPRSEDETGDLQSVAALRQAAREVFLASPKQSPLPSHKPAWEVGAPHHHSTTSSVPLSAANVVGLPEQTTPTTTGTKVSGRLPAPKYHLPSTVTTSNGYRSNNNETTPSSELKSPLTSLAASSRIPRLPSTGLSRQSSGLPVTPQLSGNDSPAPQLPPKQQSSPPVDPPALQPKLSLTSSRIPPPQVHTPVLSPPSSRSSFSPLPVHSARLVTPTASVAPAPAINNNDESPLNPKSLSTRIPLPKYSSAEIIAAVPVKSVAGPSPVSRIPTRLPTPTSSALPGKNNRILPSASDPNDRSSASPALTARTQ